MMVYIKGHKRNQLVMFPACMDDYVTEDNIVRFLDNFVDTLDMKELGFKRPTQDNLGAPSYDPGDMIKLYLNKKVTHKIIQNNRKTGYNTV